jgi:hypothetical protein
MTGTLHCGSHLALVFEGVTRNPARQQFALLIYKLQKKIRILVINILDAELAETTVLLSILANLWIAQKLNIIFICHD